ncbi:hypothetical protein [Sphingomonas sp. S2-65]|uniref:hypothetical protein n=1 Tax=Sphingomonas sp. S2-65 TaxID=2903960 RepID=UPI001F386980|nr:hypothetical protein [Sphingomonas sp. S2-65]UYY59949.1 hypothetical protein LZ586_07650 [Sphingomonas sp. S2-65]
MNAPANLPHPTAAARERAQRHDGWTPDRQRYFLEAIAEGQTVESAARLVGMSAASAYAFRRRAPATTFAMGWSGANLLARERLAAMLFSRAMEGQVETLTRPDGSTIARHKFDNRLAATMLARLDRQADDPVCGPALEAARLIAQEFDAFLDMVERDEGPARTGLFLGTRAAGSVDLAPIVSLARADRYLRTGVPRAEDVTTADLDVTRRTEWSAEQWQRAEAAGLLVLGPPPRDGASGPQLPQLHDGEEGDEDEDADGLPPVWWADGEWRTSYPPPEDFWGDESGSFGNPEYSRSLTEEEEAAHEAIHTAINDEDRAIAERRRDRYFGFATAPAAEEDAPEPPAAAPDRVPDAGVAAAPDLPPDIQGPDAEWLAQTDLYRGAG